MSSSEVEMRRGRLLKGWVVTTDFWTLEVGWKGGPRLDIDSQSRQVRLELMTSWSRGLFGEGQRPVFVRRGAQVP